MNSKFLAEAARGTASRAEIGGKAANLAALEKAGLPVPDWVVISSKTLAEFSAGDPGESFSFPFDFLNEIANVLPGVESFAVRSSAAIEDGATDSYAGIFESVLEVTRAKLPEALLHVWRSGFSPRVKEYRQARGLGEIEMKIAVIIQALFPAEVAGVAFGINPLTGKADERVIEAVAGLGEGLVSGKLDSDQFIVRGAIVERRLRQPAGSTTLSDGELLEISGRLDSLARHFGVPQDIEFARAGGKIMYLQSRPITAITRHEETVWENNNLIESYPGMTTPLTFDFVKKTYEIGYRQVSAMIGLPRSTIEENSARYAGMIGLLRNRMYYNLTNILAITRTVPGSNVLERSFTSAIGITDESPKKPKGLSDLTALLRFLFRTALRLFTLWLRLPSMRRKFVTDLDRILTDARKEPLATRSFDEVVNYFRELERTVFGIWRAPPLNGLFTMVFFRGLEVLTRRLRLDIDRPNLRNELLVGAENIVSTEPIIRIAALTENIRRDPPARELFARETADGVWTRLSDPAYARLRAEIDDYLERYGDRCVGGELKLETPSYTQAPAIFIRILQSYLAEDVRLSFDQGRNREIRATAERELELRLSGRPFSRFVYRRWLSQARSMVVWRENLRFKRSQAFGIVKMIFGDLGKKLALSGHLTAPNDVFFLTMDEVFTRPADLKIRVIRRRASYEMNIPRTLPARVRTRYPFDFETDAKILPEPTPDTEIRKNLRGIGCSSGIVRGKVRIIRSPDDIGSLGGDILVTESTDPGWVKLFPTASAILLERGSLLSHAGIVTREMGIPCVVGVKGLLASIRDHDTVELDGSTGEVRILT